MALKEEFARTGAVLFRWRSYLPLAFLPLFVYALSDFAHKGPDDRFGDNWDLACVLLAFGGIALRALVVGRTPDRTSGRNTREQVADVLNTTGMYSAVRHPLYLGNFVSWIGIAMFTQSLLTVIVAAMAFALYYERIMFAEEKFLRSKFRTSFDEWAERTPAFFPRLSGWKPSPHPFSWKLVLRREYSGMFAIVVTFTGLDAIREWFSRGSMRVGPGWLAFLAAGTIAYLALRTAKKSGRLPIGG